MKTVLHDFGFFLAKKTYWPKSCTFLSTFGPSPSELHEVRRRHLATGENVTMMYRSLMTLTLIWSASTIDKIFEITLLFTKKATRFAFCFTKIGTKIAFYKRVVWKFS